jgi:hypothetical protein
MLLIRELWTPTDDAVPLSAREIAEKFDVSMGRVYGVVHMPAEKLETLRSKDAALHI